MREWLDPWYHNRWFDQFDYEMFIKIDVPHLTKIKKFGFKGMMFFYKKKK